MVRLPTDPGDTDWGQRVEKRLDAIEHAMEESKFDRVKLHAELAANTSTLAEMKKDIQSMIDLLRGSKVVAYIIAWSAAIATGASGLWGLWHWKP